jgi:succinoglycan biosynthesis transport protein ExoP
MLDRYPNRVAATPISPPDPSPGLVEIGLPHILGFLRRQRAVIALCVAAVLALGFAYLVVAPALYKATSWVLIDTRKMQIFGQGDVFQESTVSNTTVETQVQILQSGKIAADVVDLLDLTHDPDFMSSDWDPIGAITGRVRSLLSGTVDLVSGLFVTPEEPAPSSAVDRTRQRAIDIFQKFLTVEREGLSYVITVGFTSTDPATAARIANETTKAYLADQANSQAASAQRASKWLQARILELQEQAAAPGLSPQEKSAIRATHDSFLQRYTEAVQQQSLPVTEARTITEAVPPRSKSSPKALFTIIASLAVGGMLGLGVALLRDLLDRTVRTRQQLESVTGLACLGLLPTFDLGGRAMRRAAKRRKKLLDVSAQKFAAGPTYSVVLSAPFSRFSETLRGIKVAVDTAANGPLRVLGVASSIPNEGKTTVAVNLARLAAQSGSRVLLIDGDLRNPVLSQNIVPPEAPGLMHLATGRGQLSELIWSDQATRLHFLPAGVEGKLANGSEFLSSNAMKALLDGLRKQYDLIIVDLPAILSVVDVRAAAHQIDGFVFVVGWGQTTEDMVVAALQEGGIEGKVIGTVLNKVDLSALRRFSEPYPANLPDKYLEADRQIA